MSEDQRARQLRITERLTLWAPPRCRSRPPGGVESHLQPEPRSRSRSDDRPRRPGPRFAAPPGVPRPRLRVFSPPHAPLQSAPLCSRSLAVSCWNISSPCARGRRASRLCFEALPWDLRRPRAPSPRQQLPLCEGRLFVLLAGWLGGGVEATTTAEVLQPNTTIQSGSQRPVSDQIKASLHNTRYQAGAHPEPAKVSMGSEFRTSDH